MRTGGMESLDYGRLFVPELMVAAQMVQAPTLTPEQELCIAVLRDAIDTILGHAKCSDLTLQSSLTAQRRRAILAEAITWLWSDRRVSGHPFTAAAICDVTGLDLSVLRRGVRDKLAAERPELLAWCDAGPPPVAVEFPTDMADLIREACYRQGLNRRTLALRLGVAHQTLHGWFYRNYLPRDPEQLRRLRWLAGGADVVRGAA